jgi:hypothetical protein
VDPRKLARVYEASDSEDEELVARGEHAVALGPGAALKFQLRV